ncbi:MAG TPA: M12 family metallo-peptidase, partial [Pyrinomonadaceae bacterium]
MKPSPNIQRFPVSQISKTAFRLAASAAIFVITLFCSVPAYAESNLWRKINESDLLLIKSRESKPKSYGVFELNSSTLSQALAKTSKERFDNAAMSGDSVVTLPLPDGRFWRFKIEESAIMSPELSAKYPEIRNYSGQGIDDPTATMRINWTPKGLNAYVASSQFTFLVVPYSESNSQYYLSYFSQDENGDAFKCSTSNFTPAGENNLSGEDHLTVTGSVLRRYRLAISVTRQFYLASGENDAAAVAAVTNFVSNINVIYERELTIRFVIVYMAFDRFGTVFPPNQDLGQANEINQFQLDHLIGTGAYDIGHLLGYNAPMPNGLVSVLGSLCQPSKAKGGTVLSQNIYWGSVVFAHEVGHQLGAVHTWGLGSGSCNAGQFASGGWFEPGSGSTLMSYAGICGNSNLQQVSNDYFHVDSLFKIINFIDSPPMLACAQRTITGNSPPVVTSASSNSTIPALTPFTLTASASDANGDALLYNWEQYNLGTPFFRSYLPSPNPSRTFPSPFYILNYGNSPPAFFNGFASGEFMPTTSGTFGFWLTVRDTRAGGGGISTQQQFLQIAVNAAAGPFTVTQPNTNVSWGAGSQQVVTWSVANTNLPPIGTANVRILLSTDGGNTF